MESMLAPHADVPGCPQIHHDNLQVQIVSAGGPHPQELEGIVASLRDHSITPEPGEASSDGSPTLLFFDDITPELFEIVRHRSGFGLHRLLAIATTGEALAESRPAWSLLASGAADLFAWDRIADPAGVIAARLERWNAVDTIVDSPVVRENLVGRSRAWITALRQIVEIAHFTDASLLITGESGTGKELIARLVHTLDPRAPDRNMIIVDCTTVVPELSGSEFFGHVRGAFTNAITSRDGAFALADGGTLFLDEVGELPLTLQAELLRAVQERTYKRVGSNEWQQVAFRLICATNRDLLQEEAQGNFRRDFYYRIASWVCHLPPLRDRIEDILPLARHFMKQLLPRKPLPELDSAVSDYLLQRDYPGNIRDLKQLVSRILCRHVGSGPITVGDIPEEERPEGETVPQAWCDRSFEISLRRALTFGVGLKEIGRAATETAIGIALDDEQGNIQRAARRLGITDRALQLRQAGKRNGD